MRKNWLAVLSVPFILLLVAGTAWSAVTSGAASMKIYQDTNTTTLGGDSVNFAVNVLNSEGAVNLVSNGQAGDVLLEITSQLAVPGGIAGGAFAADVNQFPLPGQGVYRFSIAYGGVSGTDTVVVNMYESVSAGVNAGGAVIVTPGPLLESQTLTVTVGQGSPTVDRLAVICGNVGASVGPDPNLAVNNDLTSDAGIFGRVTHLFGETLYDEGADADLDVTASNAGVDFGLHVRATNGANAVNQSVTGATAKVYFTRVSSMSNTLAAGAADTTPSTKAKIYTAENPDGVDELEVTLTDGAWDGIIQLKQSGWWLPVVYQDHDDGARAINVQRAQADNANGIILHRVAPGAPASMTLTAGTTAVEVDPAAPDVVVDNAIQRGFLVSLLDANGNAAPAPTALTVSFAASPDGVVQNLVIGAGASSGRTPNAGTPIDLPDAIGNWTVTASIPALGLTSNSVNVKVVAAAIPNTAAGVLWIDDDGVLDGVRAYTAGQEINIWLDQAWVAAGGLVGATAYLGSYTATIQKTEQGVYGVDQDANALNTIDYVCSFPATAATADGSFWFGIQGDPIAPFYFEDNGPNNFCGAVAGAGAVAASAGQDIDVAASAATSIAYLDYSSSAQTTYDLLFGDTFTLWGQRFMVQDMHGNNVPPTAALNFFAGLSSGDSNSFTLPGANLDLDDWAPGNAPGVPAVANNVGLNAGLNATWGAAAAPAGVPFVVGETYAIAVVGTTDFTAIGAVSNTVGEIFVATGVGAGTGTASVLTATSEWVQIDYADTVADDADTITGTLSSTAGSTYDFSLLNIGNPFTQIRLSSNSGVIDTIEMPQNGVLPVLVETLDANNNRLPSDAINDLLITVGNTNLTVRNDSAGAALLATGSTLGTFGLGGRAILRVNAGSDTGQTTLKVQTTDGTIVSNTLTIDVKAQAPDQPIQGDEIVAGSGSTDPADVTVTTDDTVDLFVFTDIDGFTPTACWVTLNIDGTNFYWVYDEANSAWVRFNFVAADHADFDASFPTLAEAITDYPFTATGADQQVGNDLPMTGLSGLVFKVTVWYFDADGALQSFDYLVTVS